MREIIRPTIQTLKPIYENKKLFVNHLPLFLTFWPVDAL